MKPRTKKWLFALGTITLVAYLVVMGLFTARAREAQKCQGIFIHVIDSAKQHFVTVNDLRSELGRLPSTALRTPLSAINTDSLEQMLRIIDKIEWVDVRRLTNSTIHITVEPMRPIARIFEPGTSYYINKDGKRISADARYYVDVPVIAGAFPDSAFTAASLIPLVNFIESNDRWRQLVSMIKVDSPNDVIIIPAVKGLVFNIGRAENFGNKFARLDRMIAEVLPSKGWTFYDTLSVKWTGQVVATRRIKAQRDTTGINDEVLEKDDISTMTVGDNVAAGQALPGHQANGEKPVPAPKKQPQKKQ